VHLDWGRVAQARTPIYRASIVSQFQASNASALGVRAWGDITMTDSTMTDSKKWKERRDQVAR